uniref:Chlorophyll a-b binding protein, chloroplastic n=1 Tax=Chrysotila carterae TaxID=13221 RepID=A0A7S4B945_CHRCT
MARNALTILSMLGAAEALTTGVVLRAPKVRTARLTMQDAAAPAEAAEEEAVPPPPPPPPPVEYSQSMPFLVKRKALNGYVGDVGFDPLGFSEILPMDWLREAELKHCRVCMLATVGFVFTDFLTLPGSIYQVSTLDAHDVSVASGSMSQLLLWIGIAEIISVVAIQQMLAGSGRAPGEFGAEHKRDLKRDLDSSLPPHAWSIAPRVMRLHIDRYFNLMQVLNGNVHRPIYMYKRNHP